MFIFQTVDDVFESSSSGGLSSSSSNSRIVLACSRAAICTPLHAICAALVACELGRIDIQGYKAVPSMWAILPSLLVHGSYNLIMMLHSISPSTSMMSIMVKEALGLTILVGATRMLSKRWYIFESSQRHYR